MDQDTLRRHLTGANRLGACYDIISHVFGRPGDRSSSAEDLAIQHGIIVRDASRDEGFDGRLRQLPSGQFEISVSPSMESRRAFTIAHELAHWALFKVVNETEKLDHYSGYLFETDVEERFANSLAAEILMPLPSIAKHKQGIIDAFELGRTISREYSVSLKAAVRRISEVFRTNSLQLILVPKSFKDLNSRAIVDKATLFSSDGLTSDRDGVTLKPAAMFAELAREKNKVFGISFGDFYIRQPFELRFSERPLPHVIAEGSNCVLRN